MNKKIIVLPLMIVVVFILVGVQVFAANNQISQYLEQKQYVWVGQKKMGSQGLMPVALTGSLNDVMTQSEYALTLAIQESVDSLLRTKKTSTSQIRGFFRNAIDLPSRTELMEGNRLLIQTGGDGIAEFEAEKGRYAVQVVPVALVNINVPQSVNVNLDEYVIPIGINDKGDRTVRKIADSESGGLVKEVMAQESSGNSKVKVAVYYDKNNNGKWDSDENIVPWAGIRVDLLNLSKKSGIQLSEEWKDIYLDGARNGLKASDLVNDLSQNCPTAGVSVVDGDTRKTFLKREGRVFGSDDFDIESGKVYSIKGCEVPFYIIGYDLEKQFEKK